jgi:hypothetical protein
MSKKVKFSAGAALQLGLIASIGDYVGWPYMNYVLYATVFFFLLTLVLLIVDMAKD